MPGEDTRSAPEGATLDLDYHLWNLRRFIGRVHRSSIGQADVEACEDAHESLDFVLRSLPDEDGRLDGQPVVVRLPISDVVERAIEATRAKRREQDSAHGDGYYEHFPPSADEREEIIEAFAAVLREPRS